MAPNKCAACSPKSNVCKQRQVYVNVNVNVNAYVYGVRVNAVRMHVRWYGVRVGFIFVV